MPKSIKHINSRLTKRWYELVVCFFKEYLCGEKDKINETLEKMADFILENKGNISEHSFLMLESLIEKLYVFVNFGEIFQVAQRVIYSKRFLFNVFSEERGGSNDSKPSVL